jgi:hypothetical protein
MPVFVRQRKHATWQGSFLTIAASLTLATTLTGCASSKLETAGSLSNYGNLTTANSRVTQSQQRIDKADVLAAKTIVIVPTKFSASVVDANLNEKQRGLIANAIDRSICLGLSDRFKIVGADQPADLKVHATITHITTTNRYAAGASQALSSVLLVSPRIPVGMGNLSIEAEARDGHGVQKAAMVWARGASALSTARVSTAGDAYDLASAFGGDFSKLLVTGENPIDDKMSIPSLSEKPKSAACDVYGHAGVTSRVGGMLGAPPEWLDKGAADGTDQGKATASPDENPK